MARDGHNLHHIHHSDCGPRSLPHSLSLSLSLIQGRGQNLFFPHSVFEATISLCRSAGTAPGGPSMDGRTDDVLSYDELRGWAKHDGSSDRWPSGASGPLSLSLSVPWWKWFRQVHSRHNFLKRGRIQVFLYVNGSLCTAMILFLQYLN